MRLRSTASRLRQALHRTGPAPTPPRAGWRTRAEASGWALAPADVRLTSLLDRLAGRHRGQGRDPRFLLVVDDATQRLGAIAAGHDVCTLPVDDRDLRRRLMTEGPWDVIVLDTADAARRRDLLLRLAFAVVRGGELVVARVRLGVARPEDSVVRFVADVVDHTDADRAPRGVRGKDLPHLQAAWRDVELAGDHLVLRNGVDAYVKIFERDANDVLAHRPERGRVLTSVPGGPFRPRATLRESESAVAGSWRQDYEVPDVFLREYADVVAAPGQVLLQGRTVLSDSFRHTGRPHPNNRYTPQLGQSFVRAPGVERTPEPAVLEEPHFYWDSEFRGHFGHVMTEMLARMWAFDEARRRHPGLKVLMAINKDRELGGHEVAILEAFGAGRDDITFIRKPVRVRTMLAATPMFSQPQYVHPEIAAVWDRVGRHLAAQAPDRDYPRRIFIARRIEKRPCRNAAEVEKLFAEHGFDLVYPEDYPLAEQARMFREADTIAGFAGSGLFTVMLAERPKHLIMVCSESYNAENEWMIAAVRGHRVDVAWCEAEIKRQKGRFVEKAFHSPFTFDFDREGAFVKRILAELP